MKILSLFSGIGAFEKALDYLNINYELVNYCEIDKYASKAYSLIHNVSEDMNLGDITKVDTSKLPKDIDLITYGFPCQDISLAGKQQGMFNNDGSKTRSGLFFEALRIIEDTKPKIAIAENVKNLVSQKFNVQFQAVLQSLEEAGYNNYWKVLNANDFGIPQNRERVFIVSIRKDIDECSFEFPKPFELKLQLKDLLRISNDKNTNLWKEAVECTPNDTISRRKIWNENPKIVDEKGNLTKERFIRTITTKQDRHPNSGNIYFDCGIEGRGKFRYLTPRECFLFMGFEDKDVDFLIENKIPNTELYKMAGNSIVVDVLKYIFVELFKVINIHYKEI